MQRHRGKPLAQLSPPLTAILLLHLAQPVLAQESGNPRMIILDRTLSRIPAELDQIGPNTIQYLDASGRPRSIERSKTVAIYSRKAHGPSIPTSGTGNPEHSDGMPGLLRLTDGQIVPGFLTPSGENSETLQWRSRRIGSFGVKLDRVSSIAFADSLHLLPPASKQDLLLLSNDDRIEGFVESIGKDISIDSGGNKSTFPIERLSAARFANPLAAGSQPLVFLSDGSVLAATEITPVPAPKGTSAPKTATVLWSLAADSGTGVVDIPTIDAVLFDPRTLVPLASLPIASTEGLDGRRWTPKPEITSADSAPIGLATITFSGPVKVEWKLPAGARRFGASLELPADARPWGNASVVISFAGRDGKFREAMKKDLTADAPAADAAFDLPGADLLRIEIRGRAYSDVQARVKLIEPVILIASDSPAPAPSHSAPPPRPATGP